MNISLVEKINTNSINKKGEKMEDKTSQVGITKKDKNQSKKARDAQKKSRKVNRPRKARKFKCMGKKRR